MQATERFGAKKRLRACFIARHETIHRMYSLFIVIARVFWRQSAVNHSDTNDCEPKTQLP